MQLTEGLEDVNAWPLQHSCSRNVEGRAALWKTCHRTGYWKVKHTEAQRSLPAPLPSHKWGTSPPEDLGSVPTISARWGKKRWNLKCPFPPWKAFTSRSEKFSKTPGPVLQSAHCIGNIPFVPLPPCWQAGISGQKASGLAWGPSCSFWLQLEESTTDIWVQGLPRLSCGFFLNDHFCKCY